MTKGTKMVHWSWLLVAVSFGGMIGWVTGKISAGVEELRKE